MAIVINDLQMEKLAKQLANAEGVSVIEVLREGLLSLASVRGLRAQQAEPLRTRLAALAREVDALPNREDPRSDDEILGYNANGTW